MSSTAEVTLALKAAMTKAELGGTFRKMTPSALRKAVEKAESTSETMVQRSLSFVSVDFPKSMMAEAEKTAGSAEADAEEAAVSGEGDAGEAAVRAEAGVEGAAVSLEADDAVGSNHSFSPELLDVSPEHVAGMSRKKAQSISISVQIADKQAERKKKTGTKRKADSTVQRSRAKKLRPYNADHSKHVAVEEQMEYTDPDNFETNRQRLIGAQAKAKKYKEKMAREDKRKKVKKQAELENARKPTITPADTTIEDVGETQQPAGEPAGETEQEAEFGVQATIERPQLAETQAEGTEQEGMEQEGTEQEGTEQEGTEQEGTEQEGSKELDKDTEWKMLRCTTYYNKRENEFTDQQKEKIKALAKRCPPFLYHVHSNKGRRHTRGSATRQQMKPAASVDDRPVYGSIYDFPTLSELIFNFGCRILWYIRKADQFSSYTTSLLFAFVHALGRKIRGETDIYISVIDTRQARTVDGEPAEFYYVPELKSILDMTEWVGWGPMQFSKVTSPWFTHEYVAHGVVDLDANASRMVPFEELIEHGLFEFAPSLHCTGDEVEMKKLYHRCLQLRHRWYTFNQRRSFDVDDLHHAARLARLFDPSSSDSIHPQVFFDLVGLSRRYKNDLTFLEYVRAWFGETDVQGLIYPNMTRIPANLPENMQTLDRIRDACAAFGLPSPPDQNTVILVDHHFDFNGKWNGRLQDITTKKKKEVSAAVVTGEQAAKKAADGDNEAAGARPAGTPTETEGTQVDAVSSEFVGGSTSQHPSTEASGDGVHDDANGMLPMVNEEQDGGERGKQSCV